MRKKLSIINPITIGILIFAILCFKMFYNNFEYSPGDPIGEVANGRLLVGIIGGIIGGIVGLILGFIVHLMFRPNLTNRLLKEQNRMIYNNNNNSKNNKIDELTKLNELKKKGAISEEEFKELKGEIVNRR